MKTLEKGQDKIEKICEILRKETLEPAQKEGERLIQEAREKAEGIVDQAEREAAQIVADARKQIEQERNVFHSSLTQASKQSLESLRQSIEHKLFNEQLNHEIEKGSSNPKLVADLINSIVKALEKQGLAADLTALVPKDVPASEVNKHLLAEVAGKLENQSVAVGDFQGGAQVRIRNKKMTIDISDEALKELVANYARKDFRKYLFSQE